MNPPTTLKNRFNVYHLLIFILLITLVVVGSVIWYAHAVLPPQFPLFFSLPSGTKEQLGTIRDLYKIGIYLSIILTINSLISIFMVQKFRILTNILTATQVVIIIVFSLSILQIIRIIT